MRSIAETLISWGLPGLFALALLDSAGIPLPATVDALLVAVAVVNPGLAYVSAAVAVVGSAAGCMVLFYISRKGGQVYLDRSTHKPRARKFRQWFLRFGLITVFVPALLPLPLPTKVFVISAGALGVRPVPFLLVVLAARIPRYFGLAWLGSQLGEHSMAWLKAHAWHLAGFAIVLCALLVLLVHFADRFHKPPAQLG